MMFRGSRTRWPAVALVAITLIALGGCAGMNTLESDVNSYSQWPAGRQPSTYAFERLPSQQANPQQQFDLEAAARDALAQAGFNEASDPASSDVTIQLGARVTRFEPYPWGDPFGLYGGLYAGFYGGYGRWHRGGFWGPGFGGGYSPNPTYDREVALLIRDRKTGQPLYEAHANSDGFTNGGTAYLTAMFAAALKDFPQPALNPRRVSIPLAAR